MEHAERFDYDDHENRKKRGRGDTADIPIGRDFPETSNRCNELEREECGDEERQKQKDSSNDIGHWDNCSEAPGQVESILTEGEKSWKDAVDSGSARLTACLRV